MKTISQEILFPTLSPSSTLLNKRKDVTPQESDILFFYSKENTMKENITYDSTFNGHSINTNKDKSLGCYEKVLNKIETVMNSMLDNHSKIMITRLDLRYPNNDNIICETKHISDFTSSSFFSSVGDNLKKQILPPVFDRNG